MIGQSVQWKYRIDMLKVKVTAKVHILIVSSDDIFWAAEPFVINHHTSECYAKKEWVAFFKVKVTARAPIIKTWLLLVLISKVHNHTPDCLVKRLLFTRSHQKVQIFIQCLSFCSDNLVMLHESQCHEKRLFCCDQDHSIGWLINNLIISIVSSELLNLLHPNLVWSVLWNNLIAVLMIKVTVMTQNFTECSSVLYFQHHW